MTIHCRACGFLISLHPEDQTKSQAEQITAYHTPAVSDHPRFRDPADIKMHNPALFWAELTRFLTLRNTPRVLYESTLLTCLRALPKELALPDWINNMRDNSFTWTQVEAAFLRFFEGADQEEVLARQLRDTKHNL